MRSRLAVLFALSLALTAGQVQAAAEDARLIANRYLDAWNDHDAEAASALLDPKVQYFDSGAATTEISRTQARDRIVKVTLKAVPDLQVKMVHKPVIGPRSIAFEWELTGNRVTATGKQPVKIRGASIMKIRDGRIWYLGDYYDSDALEAMLRPAKP